MRIIVAALLALALLPATASAHPLGNFSINHLTQVSVSADRVDVTYVLDGALQHRDSLGNGSILRAGELQRMTAGTGVRHSEFNPSEKEWVHPYQIWLLPQREGLEPSYEETCRLLHIA